MNDEMKTFTKEDTKKRRKTKKGRLHVLKPRITVVTIQISANIEHRQVLCFEYFY